MRGPYSAAEGAPRRRVTRRLAALGALAMLSAAGVSRAADRRLQTAVRAEQVPDERRSAGGLHLTAREAYTALQHDSRVLLIDVRTHGETVFSGVAEPMHRHIPYMLVDADHGYDGERRRYRLSINPDFPKAVAMLFADYGLARDASVILYCSTGERSAKAASYLAHTGYGAVYTIVDGFEGEAGATDALGAGWKRSGLPWTMELTPSQIYKSPSM